jgi:hypothetical protein
MRDQETALGLINATDPDELMEHLVSSRVNSVRNNDPKVREPAEPDTLF